MRDEDKKVACLMTTSVLRFMNSFSFDFFLLDSVICLRRFHVSLNLNFVLDLDGNDDEYNLFLNYY